MTERKRGRPAGPEPTDLRQSIRLAAIELFGERGFEGVSLSQISARAGADTGLVRYYFGSKADLWEKSMSWLAETFATEIVEHAPTGGGTATDDLTSVIRAFLRASARWPQVSRIIVLEGNSENSRGAFIAERLVVPFFELMSHFIDAAKAEGALPAVSARTIFFMITHGGSFPMALPRLTNAVEGGDIAGEAALSHHADAVIALVLCPPD